MSFLQENILYFWLLPVAFQICLPLAMFLVWCFARVLVGVFKLNKPAPAPVFQG